MNPLSSPGIVEIDLFEGVGVDNSSAKSDPISFRIGFGRPIVRLENLLHGGLDEGTGNIVTDYMNGFIGTFRNSSDGNVTFDTADKQFGNSALKFPKNAWVSTNALASQLSIGGSSPRTISSR